MYTPAERATALARAERLRAAADLIAANMLEGRDRTDVLRRVGLAIANLTEPDTTTTTCRRCGATFTFNAARFARRHLDPPRHCFHCRQARRAERNRAGVPGNVPPP